MISVSLQRLLFITLNVATASYSVLGSDMSSQYALPCLCVEPPSFLTPSTFSQFQCVSPLVLAPLFLLRLHGDVPPRVRVQYYTVNVHSYSYTTTTTAAAATPFNGLFSRTTWLSRYHKGKTSLDINEARNNGVLGCSGNMQTICTSLKSDNHTNMLSLNFYRPGARFTKYLTIYRKIILNLS